ncbi:MAG: citrate/2-methylcitrate synthase [Acidimicrobiia bacterium]
MPGEPRGWLTAEEAIARLGVKPQTLYAYVSRGLVEREPQPGTRRSRYRRVDIERLASGSRPVSRAGRLDVVVDTSLTALEPNGTLTYRGWSVVDAARTSSFETVAEWLWLGERRAGVRWTAPPDALAVARAVQDALPRGTRVLERMRLAIETAATVDVLRYDRRPSAVAERGRRMIATAVDALPALGSVVGGDDAGIAARAWPRFTSMPATGSRIRALEAALVLLADHELAASAFATRVAASTWADTYAAVGAGLATLGGPLHGGASDAVRALLRRVESADAPEQVVGEQLRGEGSFPGFGHRVYQVDDPRVAPLLEAVRDAGASPRLLDAAESLRAVAQSAGAPPVNVDFALGVFAEAFDLTAGGDAVFALARCAGLVGHAIEEYGHRLRYRPRAAYVGPLPGPAPDAM